MSKQDLNNLIEDFSLFDDWEDRYAYLIDLGKKIESLPEEFKRDEFLVKGCTSKVWLIMERDDKGAMRFKADSDAHIVKGLVAIVLRVYDGCDPDEIASINMESGFKQMGLEAHLSPSRRNGFFSMIDTIRQTAKAKLES